MSTHWWHQDRTGDKELVAKKGNLNAMDEKASQETPVQREPAIEPAAGQDESGASREPSDGTREEGQQDTEAQSA